MARIGFTTTVLSQPWGGSEELWSRAALELCSGGHEVGVRVRRWSPSPARITELEARGAKLFWRYKRRPLMRILSEGAMLARTRKWPPEHGWLRSFRPDLVLISLGIQREGQDIGRACREDGLPYAIVVQAAGEAFAPEDLEQARAFFAGAERVFFVARENLELVEAQLGIDLAHAGVVWNPFNVSWGAAPAWPAGDGLELACIGRLEPAAKGQDVLLEVLSRSKWRRRDVRLRLFGRGPGEDELRALKRKLELAHVEFAGFAGDVESIWSEHHALVLPSRFEGTPLVVVEAMLCGRPCVVTPTAGRDLVVEGESGFVAEACEADALDAALERAWQAQDQLRAMGARAASAIRERAPADPARAFAAEIDEIVAGLGTGSAGAPG